MVETIWVEKYRPKKLDEILGQEEIVSRLKSYVSSKSIPNLLFAGPPGTGKTTAALALARELYGENWRQNFLELNASVSKDTEICVEIDNVKKDLTFEELYEEFLNKNKPIRVINSEYIKVNNLKVLSTNSNGEVKWFNASCIIRHKTNKLLEIKLENGSKLKITGNHSVIIYKDRFLTIDAKDIKPGDFLLTIEHGYDKAIGDLRFIRVKDIKVINYNDYVYDISVPNNEMFIAGETPILLHNSDERGIDVVRSRIKDFARTLPIGDFSHKIVFLDEADAMTKDAQQALRRIMEMFASTCRFILSCNYSSKIIEPIQSRCVIFRFKPLSDEHIRKRILYIAQNEGLKLTEDAVKAILYIAEGDMRKAINVLQAASAYGREIDGDIIYKITSRARPELLREIIVLALNGNFIKAREKLREVMITYGMSGEDVITQLHRETFALKIPERAKIELVNIIGEFDYRIREGSNELIQLEALLAFLTKFGEDVRKGKYGKI